MSAGGLVAIGGAAAPSGAYVTRFSSFLEPHYRSVRTGSVANFLAHPRAVQVRRRRPIQDGDAAAQGQRPGQRKPRADAAGGCTVGVGTAAALAWTSMAGSGPIQL